MNIQEEIAAAKAILPALPGVHEFALIGSAMYLQDANDVDFAVMLREGQHAVDYGVAMESDGWMACGDYDSEQGTWYSVRRGNLNLMLTHDRGFFDRYKLAMEVCKVLRLERKEDRIAVCQVVRDGLSADQVRPQIHGSLAEFLS